MAEFTANDVALCRYEAASRRRMQGWVPDGHVLGVMDVLMNAQHERAASVFDDLADRLQQWIDENTPGMAALYRKIPPFDPPLSDGAVFETLSAATKRAATDGSLPLPGPIRTKLGDG